MNVGYLASTWATQHVFCEQNGKKSSKSDKKDKKNLSISANRSVVRSVDSQAFAVSGEQLHRPSPESAAALTLWDFHCIVRDVRASLDQVGHKSNRCA